MSVFKLGDRVTHVNPEVSWDGVVIGTHKSHHFDRSAGVLVHRRGIDAEGMGVLIPLQQLRLEPVEAA